jgi:hypothetical protein
MAVNKPTGDKARKGAVKKRTQLATKTMGKKTWTKRDKTSGAFSEKSPRQVEVQGRPAREGLIFDSRLERFRASEA